MGTLIVKVDAIQPLPEKRKMSHIVPPSDYLVSVALRSQTIESVSIGHYVRFPLHWAWAVYVSLEFE